MALQGLVDVIMGYVIKHKEILDQAANQSREFRVHSTNAPQRDSAQQLKIWLGQYTSGVEEE